MQTLEGSKKMEGLCEEFFGSAESPLPLEPRILQLAFARFSEASASLEKQYELLRKETEDLRARLKEKDIEIARTAKLAMLGETAAAIAHEVRNPLGSIKLFVSLLRQDLVDRPDSLEMIDGINKSLATLDNVVSNILHFARQQSPILSPVNIHSIIQEQVRSLLGADKADLKVLLDLQAMPFVCGSEDGLRQVFYNLILNAMQAMRYRGQIFIRTTTEENGFFKATIKDSGPGISNEMLGRIFEPFVTSKNEGTGLGLAIVKKIVSQHKGTIEAANDAGAVFTLLLPQEIES